MKVRNLVLMVLVLAAAGGTLLALWNWNTPTKPVEGKLLIEDFPMDKIAWIDIRSAEDSVSLAKKGGRWVIEDRFDYPAGPERVANLLRGAKQVKVGRIFDGTDEIFSRLTLKDPDEQKVLAPEKGTRVIFRDRDKKALVSLILGSRRTAETEGPPGDPGQYVRFMDDNSVYLVDRLVPAWSASPRHWMNETLVKIKPDEIQRISCTSTAGKETVYVLEREATGKDFIARHALPPSRELSKSKLLLLGEALSPLAVEDVFRPEQGAPATDAFPFQIEYRLFNGFTYRVYPSREENPNLVRLEVAFQGREGGKEADGLAAEAQEIHERLSPWSFKAPLSKRGELITNPNDLLMEARQRKK